MDQEELNSLLKEFLVSKRELSGLSQREVAARSEVYGMGKTLDQKTVSRIEQRPISADAMKIAGYLSAVGVHPRQYYDLLSELTYKKDGELMILEKENNIPEQFSTALNKIAETKSMVANLTYSSLQSLKLSSSFEETEVLLKGLKKKPVIGFFGRFDVGKSTLINTVINNNVLPVKYTPATCLVNLVVHIEDRPSSISGTVALFKKGFSPYMMHDKNHVEGYLVEQGDASVLYRLGVHSYDGAPANEAYVAMVFSNADILRHVWLLDTPGDLNSEDGGDTEKALGSVEIADGIVFISSHMGFLNENDLSLAVNIIRQRPPKKQNEPIRHLLFVQSHCHSEIGNEEVLEVGRLTFKRIRKQLDDLLFNPWKDGGYIKSIPSEEELTAKVQPFWRENKDFRIQTLKRINEMTEYLVTHHEKVVKNNIDRVVDQLGRILHNAVDVLESGKKDMEERRRAIEEQVVQFRYKEEKLVEEFEKLIGSCRSRKISDMNSMNDYFKRKTSEEHLTDIIKETYDDKKTAQEGIGNYVGQLLTVKLESILRESGKSISDEVEKLLGEWQEAVPSVQKTSVGSIDNVSAFDSNAAFTSGLIGLSTLGAMSLYVSSAIASNLGAYILVAHVAGWLTSLGLVGSVTTVTSFVAAIGGPITIGIGLAAAVGSLAYRLIGGSWQKRLAKQVATQIRKKNLWSQIEKTINEFWDNTEEAVSAGLSGVRVETRKHIDSLRKNASEEHEIYELNKCLEAVEEAVYSLGIKNKSSEELIKS